MIVLINENEARKLSAPNTSRSWRVANLGSKNVLWDEYMDASAARFQQEHWLRRLVVLAGSGHSERNCVR